MYFDRIDLECNSVLKDQHWDELSMVMTKILLDRKCECQPLLGVRPELFKYYVFEYCFHNEYGVYIKNIRHLDSYSDMTYKTYLKIIKVNSILQNDSFLNGINDLKFSLNNETKRFYYFSNENLRSYLDICN